MSQGLHPDQIPSMTVGYDIAVEIGNRAADLIGRSGKLWFIRIPKGFRPARTERFQAADAVVMSMACDPFLLAEKYVNEMSKDGRVRDHVIVADAVRVHRPVSSSHTWAFEVYGWWVPAVIR